MALAPGSHTQETPSAPPHCTLDLRREQAPLPLTDTPWQVHTGAVSHTHMQSNAARSTHPDHRGQSPTEALGYEREICVHTHAHLQIVQTITHAHRHAHRHPKPPTLRLPHRCPARPQHQAPPPPLFRSRWRGLGLRALAFLLPLSGPALQGPESQWSLEPAPRPPTWLGERLARRGGWEAWS